MGSVVADAVPHPGVRRPLAGIAVAATVVIAVDQLTKWWALGALADPARTIDLVWTLRFRLVENTGTAFGLTTDSGRAVSVIGVVVIAVLVVSGSRQRSPRVVVAYGMVLGGTIGNLIDRVARADDGALTGPVIDFIDVQWFPVFNVADSALVLGIGALLYLGVRRDELVDGASGGSGGPGEPGGE